MTSPPVPRTRTPGRAYVVWGVGLLAYVVAIFHRGSLGVAGLQAQERFAAGASAISLFLVLQLAVYAALQVPVGTFSAIASTSCPAAMVSAPATR
jgi:hypothetical protein